MSSLEAVRRVGITGHVRFPPWEEASSSFRVARLAGTDFLGPTANPAPGNVVFLRATEPFGGLKVLVALFSQGGRMEHSGLHPEFGLFSPTPRIRRELRIAAVSLLFGGIAGALCVSGVVALRHSDNAATEITEAAHAAASQESEPGTGPSADARAASPESHAGIAAPPQASAEAPAQRSSETSAPAVVPASAIAPKARMVRIRKAVDSPPIARLPLGRSEATAAASPPPADPPLSRQAADAAPAGNDVAAAAPEKAVARSAASEGIANLSPPKKKQKTVRAASRRNDIENDSFWREERQEDWRARAAAVNDARSAAGRAYAREGSLPVRGFWDWSR